MRTATAVASIDRLGDRWRVNDRFEAPLLVGAGGHFCPVAGLLNPRAPEGREGKDAEPVVAAQEIEFALDDAVRASADFVRGDTPELYFCPDLLGYGWCFRKNGVLNIGLGRADRHRLGHHVRVFTEFLRDRRGLGDIGSPRWRGHAYLLYDSSPRKVAGDGVILIGDAAGLAYSQSGEGIRPAVESGLIAADVIIGSPERYGHRSLEAYQAALAARFGSRDASLLGRLPRGLTLPLARALVRTAWFARHVLVDRFFLRAGQTRLALS